MTDRIAYWNGTRFHQSIVSAGTPTIALLRYDM
jgi:hypothetical protein